MEKMIVNVRYCGNGGELSSRSYSYYADIPLSVGDRVVAPTYKGGRGGYRQRGQRSGEPH